MEDSKLHWYAIHTKPRWEKKVARLLQESSIEHYCPLNKVLRQWSDRKKIVLEPIFKSYVFVRSTDKKKWSLKSVPGVLNFVYWLGKPAVIKDNEIANIKRFLNEFADLQKNVQLQLETNSPVSIKNGLMMNYKGILIEVKGNKAIVLIQSMGLEFYATFDKNNLDIIP